MKVVVTAPVREEAKWYCDSCGVECFSELTLTNWYGSKNDLTKLSCNVCDECWDRIKDEIEKGFGFSFKKEDVMA